MRELTEGRGADAVILAVGGNGLIRPAMDADASRRAGIAVCADSHGEATIDPAAICVDEKTLLGSYSASVDLQEESVRFVMGREMEFGAAHQPPFPSAAAVEASNWLPIPSRIP